MGSSGFNGWTANGFNVAGRSTMVSRLPTRGLAVALAAGCLAAPAAGFAQDLVWRQGGARVQLDLAASALVGGSDETLAKRASEPDLIQGYGRLTADWTSPDGRIYGVSLEASSSDRESEALNAQEIYAYLASDFGRFEIGRQDGAADILAYRAPVVGLGQVRGDFARYAGSPALLSAYDTGDAAKITYLSPPIQGVRLGISWAPEDDRFDGGPAGSVQKDAIELGAQIEQPLASWIVGASAAWVQAEADPAGGRADIRSWSLGAQARRGPLKIGIGYVDRGDSDQFVRGFDQTEWSGGVAWIRDGWSIGLSGAYSDASTFQNRLFGLGGAYDITEHVTFRTDLVHVQQKRGPGPWEDGFTLVSELEYHF